MKCKAWGAFYLFFATSLINNTGAHLSNDHITTLISRFCVKVTMILPYICDVITADNT